MRRITAINTHLYFIGVQHKIVGVIPIKSFLVKTHLTTAIHWMVIATLTDIASPCEHSLIKNSLALSRII